MMPPKQKPKVSKQSNKNKSKTLEKCRRKKSKSFGEEKQSRKGRPPKDSFRKTKKRITHTKGGRREFNSRKSVLTVLGRARETLEERLEKQAEDENHLLEAQQSENNDYREGKLEGHRKGWHIQLHGKLTTMKRRNRVKGQTSQNGCHLHCRHRCRHVFCEDNFFQIKHFVLSRISDSNQKPLS